MKSEEMVKTIKDALKAGERVRVPTEYLHLIDAEAARSESFKERSGEHYRSEDIDAAIQRYADGAKNPYIKQALMNLKNADETEKLDFMQSQEFDISPYNPITTECDKEKVCESVCSPIKKISCSWICEEVGGKEVCQKICETVVDEICKTVCGWICKD